MTNYEYCVEMAQKCKEIAEKQTDAKLKTFYTNAARGFEMRKNKQKISEAELERLR